MPTANQPHSHRKYILAIIVVALIGLIVGGLVTSTLLVGPDVTDVIGTVSLGNPYVSQYRGSPNHILFNSAVTGNLSSGVFPDKSYQVYLPILSSGNYAVTIQWTNVTAGAVSFYSCAANPSTFSSSGQNDSLVGNIVQMPLNLSQVSAFNFRYDVKSALVDPLNAGRVLYAPARTLQMNLGINGYNILLLKVNSDATVLSAVSQLASSDGFVVGSQDPILNSNLAFLHDTWSYIFLVPILALALTCGILLSYLATNFSRRFNDYVVLKVLGANVWYGLKLLLWESWGILAISMLIAIPVAWPVSIFFLVPDPSVSVADLELSTLVSALALTLVSLATATIYSRRLGLMTVKDLKP